ncbi:MAG: capsular polysaccharide export protein [Oleiphilaceae bacterium]|jgi:capsular polysaccharide export protein
MLHKSADTEVLFLQGPLGPFFAEFAKYLIGHGHYVHKVNFNGGDDYYYDLPATNYRGEPKDWRVFLRGYIEEHNIGAIALYGDCRFYHQEAVKLAKDLNIKIMVFEEGYLRPDFITLEANGANNYSEMSFAGMKHYPKHREETFTVGNSFVSRMTFASKYFNISYAKRKGFPDYQHHRNLNPMFEGLCWLRSFARKVVYPSIQHRSLKRLLENQSGNFFVVPLQVFLDNQLKHHSPHRSIKDFIIEVMESFAKNAASTDHLLIKHHPEDQGHINYRRLIKKTAVDLGIKSRVVYAHDLHLPTFLNHSKGVITLNSTVGISALIHGIPVKTLGRSLMERAGLTSAQSLANFWKKPGTVDTKRVVQFRNYLLVHGQLNASFYKDIHKGLPNVYRHFYRLLVADETSKTVKTTTKATSPQLTI